MGPSATFSEFFALVFGCGFSVFGGVDSLEPVVVAAAAPLCRIVCLCHGLCFGMCVVGKSCVVGASLFRVGASRYCGRLPCLVWSTQACAECLSGLANLFACVTEAFVAFVPYLQKRWRMMVAIPSSWSVMSLSPTCLIGLPPSIHIGVGFYMAKPMDKKKARLISGLFSLCAG